MMLELTRNLLSSDGDGNNYTSGLEKCLKSDQRTYQKWMIMITTDNVEILKIQAEIG